LRDRPDGTNDVVAVLPAQARPAAPDLAPALRIRSGVEGTVNEIVNDHQMRRCRYRGTAKAHVQHALTAIAVNIERLSTQEPTDTYQPRTPTAFQQYLVLVTVAAHASGRRQTLPLSATMPLVGGAVRQGRP
jgi:hypothetical protein